MTALAADRATPRRNGDRYSYPVAASTKCYAGGIAVLDSAGNAKPGITGTTLTAVGVFLATVDNSAGAAAAVSANIEPGVYRFGNSSAGDLIAKANIGSSCYIVDDQTVALTNGSSTRSAAGKIVDVDSAGVWVKIGL